MIANSSISSLCELQAAFGQSLAGLSSEAAARALDDVRQVPGYETTPSLEALATPDGLAHLVLDPARFDGVSRALPLFGEIPGLRDAVSRESPLQRLNACAAALTLRLGMLICARSLADARGPGQENQAQVVASNLATVSSTMSRALKDELNWPNTVTVQNLGPFATSVRCVFDSREDHLTAEQRFHLMMISALLNMASEQHCGLVPRDAATGMRAKKMSVLIEVLYGAGFGSREWLDIAAGLHSLSRNWERFDAAARASGMIMLEGLSLPVRDEVTRGYDEFFGAEAAAALRRGGAIALLGRYLEPEIQPL